MDAVCVGLAVLRRRYGLGHTLSFDACWRPALSGHVGRRGAGTARLAYDGQPGEPVDEPGRPALAASRLLDAVRSTAAELGIKIGIVQISTLTVHAHMYDS